MPAHIDATSGSSTVSLLVQDPYVVIRPDIFCRFGDAVKSSSDSLFLVPLKSEALNGHCNILLLPLPACDALLLLLLPLARPVSWSWPVCALQSRQQVVERSHITQVSVFVCRCYRPRAMVTFLLLLVHSVLREVTNL
jgi:hypothetical protein